MKAFVLVGIGGLLSLGAAAQIKKQFSIGASDDCKRVSLQLKAKTGNCFIRPSQNKELLDIYSNQEAEEYAHSLTQDVRGDVCFVKIAMDQANQRGVGQKISYQVFGGENRTVDGKVWKFYLSETKPYSLDLDYGLGNADIDLSGLAVERLKIRTGTADVLLSYSAEPNKVKMDTFFVKVDMGSLQAKHINLANAQVVVAEVGFGNMLLDFSDKTEYPRMVEGSVGAGNLIIRLPSKDVPVLVKLSDSWLCSIDLVRSLKKIGDNTYANAAYSGNQKNAMVFDLDVSMGKITFRERPE